MTHYRPLFTIYYFTIFKIVDLKYKLLMTRFKPQISGFGKKRSTNCASTYNYF